MNFFHIDPPRIPPCILYQRLCLHLSSWLLEKSSSSTTLFLTMLPNHPVILIIFNFHDTQLAFVCRLDFSGVCPPFDPLEVLTRRLGQYLCNFVVFTHFLFWDTSSKKQTQQSTANNKQTSIQQARNAQIQQTLQKFLNLITSKLAYIVDVST